MPSKEPGVLSPPPPLPELGQELESAYERLVSFLEVSSGFKLAIATFSAPSIRERVITRVRQDARRLDVAVYYVDIEPNFAGDFVRAVKEKLPAAGNGEHLAVFVTGIDSVIYKYGQAAGSFAPRSGPTPFVAQLNFDRERIAASFSFPLVLCLEPETYKVLLRDAVDLNQWVSGHFDFEAAPAEAVPLPLIRVSSQHGEAARSGGPVDVQRLLQEIEQTPPTGDVTALQKRLTLLLLLGNRYVQGGDFRHGRAHFSEALQISRKLGARSFELAALAGLGLSCHRLGDASSAIVYYGEALQISREIGDRRAEGRVLGNVGLVYLDKADTHRAIEHLEQALRLAREVEDARAEAAGLDGLGIAYARLGEVRRSLQQYQQALDVARRINDRSEVANLLGNIGTAYRNLGQLRPAIEHHEEQLAISRDAGARRGEGHALGSLGIDFAVLGEARKAIEYFEASLTIHREIGDRWGEAQDLGNLGLAHAALGQTQLAMECYQDQLAITREIGDRLGEGQALGNLGSAYHSLGEYTRAIEYYDQDLDVVRAIGDRRGEGTALFNKSLTLERLGQRKNAIENAEAALRIYEQIEAPYAAEVRKKIEEWRESVDRAIG
ncbi:MAG TPA: tetratricopeptide repeat protein [Terriglobia bacterium]|nr:tetratricopeptide repeat protein [Terriglobia bacterium]